MTTRPLPPDDENAFDELFRQHVDRVYRLAERRYRGDTSKADDIVQEVFLAVYHQFQRDFRGLSEDGAAKMITRIAKRRLIDSFRSNRVVLVGDVDESNVVPMFAVPVPLNDPLAWVLHEEELERLWTMLARELTNTEHTVAFLSWECGLSDKKIAGIIGTTIAAVHSHKSRAKAKIAARMERADLALDLGPDQEYDVPTAGTDSTGGATA
jgi:RNA polymerase sigma factor (sigma-70 family)